MTLKLPGDSTQDNSDLSDIDMQEEIAKFKNAEAEMPKGSVEVIYPEDKNNTTNPQPINNSRPEPKYELPSLEELENTPYEEVSTDPLPIHPAIDYAVGSDKEEAQKLTSVIRNSPELTYGITRDPEYTLELTQGVSPEVAARQLDAVRRFSGKVDPSVFIVDPSVFIEGDFMKSVEFSEQDWAEYEAVENFKKLQPALSKVIINPLEAKVLSRDRALQTAVGIYNDEFGNWVGDIPRGVRGGVSGTLRALPVTAKAIVDVIDESNQEYLKDIEAGGTTIEEDKANAQIVDLERSYDGRIDELDILIDRYKTLSPDTAKQYASERIALGEERDKAVQAIHARVSAQREEEVANVKSSAKLTGEQLEAANEYINNSTLLNHPVPNSFAGSLGAGLPQIAGFIYAPEFTLAMLTNQGYASGYEAVRSEGGSAVVANIAGLATATINWYTDQTGINLIGNFKKVSKELFENQLEHGGLKKFTGALVKDITKKSVTDGFKTAGSEGLVEVIQGGGAGIVAETALIAEGKHDFETALDNLVNQTVAQSFEEGAVAGIITLFFLPSIMLDARRRLMRAMYFRGKGEKIANSFSESKTAQDHPEVAKEIIGKVVNQETEEESTTLNQNYDQFELGEEGNEFASAIYDKGKKSARVDAEALVHVLNQTNQEGQNKALNMMGLTRSQIDQSIANGDKMIEIDTVDFLTQVSQIDVGEALLDHVAMPNMEQTFAQAKNLGKAFERVLDDVRSTEDIIRKEGIKKFLKKSLTNALPEQRETIDAMVEVMSRMFVFADQDAGDFNLFENLANNVAIEGENSSLVLKPKQDIRDIINRELRSGARTLTSEKAERERAAMVAADKKQLAESGNLKIDTSRRETSVFVNGKSLPAEFRIVPADQITASHNEQTFEPNADYEAAGHYNQRNYHSDKSLQESFVGKTEPSRLISNNVGSNEGTPIVDKDGFVLSGNNRSMRIKRDIAGDRHSPYTDMLIKEAPIYGYSPEEVSQIPSPVLVRVLSNEVEDKVGMSAAFNSSVTLSNDVAAEATKRGNNIGQATINSLSKMNDGDNLGAFISNNQEAVFNALIHDGVIEDTEISDLFDRRYNHFTEIGRVVVKSAFLGKLIPDMEVLHSLNPANAKKITEMAHIILATGRRNDFSLIKDFQEVAEHLSALQNPSMDWATYTNNDLFGEKVDPNSNSVKLAKWLQNRPVAEVRKGLSRYLKSIPLGDNSQSGMFELDYDKNSLIDEMTTPEGITIPTAKEVEAKRSKTKSKMKPAIKEDLTTDSEENSLFTNISDNEQMLSTEKEAVKTELELKEEAITEAEEIDNSQTVNDIVMGNDYYYVKSAARSQGIIDYNEILGLAWENALTAAETHDPEKGSMQKRVIDSIYRTAQAYMKEQIKHSSREVAYDSNASDIQAEKNTSNFEKIYDKMNNDISKYLGKKHKELKKTFVLSVIKGHTQAEVADKIGKRQSTVTKHLQKINAITEVKRIREEAAGIATLNQEKEIEIADHEFAENVKEFISNDKINNGAEIIIKNTPDVLRAIGAKNNPIKISKKVLKKAIEDKHHLSDKDLIDIPKQLRDPLMVFKPLDPKYHDSGLIVLTEHINDKNEPVIIAVHLNEKINNYEINRIASVYGKNNTFFKNSLNNDHLLYVDKKRSSKFLHTQRLQLPAAEGNRSFLIKESLPHNSDSVNKNSDEGETLNQDKRGEIKLYPDQFKAFIKIMKDGKADTVIHEFSHLWLDHIDKLVQAEIIPADSKTAQTLSELKSYYGKDTIDTEFQESFAEDFTQYVVNGDAPAPALINAFRVIRKAMMNFYKFFKQKYSKNKLSPEITDIFNRILATEEEIEYMGKYYEYSPIAESILNDLRLRRARLNIDKDKRLKKSSMNDVDKLSQAKEKYFQKLTKTFKNNGGYQKAIDEAICAVNNMPVYKAIDDIFASGRLDYNMIKDIYGKKVADALKRHKVRTSYVDKNGVTRYRSISVIVSRGKGNVDIDLAEIALKNGFNHENSLEAENMMIQALVNADVKAKVIQAAKSDAKNRINTQIAKAVRESAEMLDYDIIDQLLEDELILAEEAEALKNAGESIEEAKARWEKRLRDARNERLVIDNQARDIINGAKVSEAIDYKNFRQQLKKAIKAVDAKLKEVGRARDNGNVELEAQLLEEAVILQRKRTMAYVAVRHSIQAFHNFQSSKSILHASKLGKKLKNINNKYAQSIIDIMYTWKLPPVQNNEKLFNDFGVNPEKLGATLILPEEAVTPLNEIIINNPSEIIPEWIKNKEASSVKSAEDGYQNMSYERFSDISTTVKMLLKTGRSEFIGMKDAKIKSIAEAAELLKKNTENHKTIDSGEKSGEGSSNRFKDFIKHSKEGIGSRVKKFHRTLGADFAMMEFVFREMDDYEVGFFTENFFDKFMDAELEYRKHSKDMKDRLDPHLTAIYREIRRLKRENNGNERFNINGVTPPEKWINRRSNENFPAHLTGENIMALCLNMGNDGNLKAIVESFDLGGKEFREYYIDLQKRVETEERQPKELQNPDILEEASSKALYLKRMEYAQPYLSNIQAMLSKDGWNAIQGVWDNISTIFPDYQKAFYANTGRYLQEEHAVPLTVTTADGSELNIKGGYYPLRYDFAIEKIDSRDELDALTNAERKTIFTSRGLNKDATHTRNRDKMGVATVGRMPQLEVASVLATHIADTIRYSTHSVVSNDFDRLLRNSEFEDTFIKKFGKEKYHALSRWSLRQARPDIDAPKNWFEKKINSLRSINTVAVLGMNVKTAIKQLLSIPLAMNEMSRLGGGMNGYWAFIDGAKEIARGASEGNNWYSNGAMEFVREASDYIRLREDDAYNLVLSDFTEKLSLKPKFEIHGKKIGVKECASFSFSLIRTADRIAVMPIWMGAFNQALEMNGVVRTENYKSLLNPAHPQSEIIKKCIKQADRVVRSTQPSTMTPDLSHAQSHFFYKLFTAFSTYTLKAFNRTNHDIKAWRNGKLGFDQLMHSTFDSYVLPSIMSSLVALLLLPEDDEPEFLDMMLDPVTGQWMATVPFLRNVQNVTRIGANPLDVSAFRPTQEVVKGFQYLHKGRFAKGAWTLSNIAGASIGLAPTNTRKTIEQAGEFITQGRLDSKKENRKEHK